MLRLLSLIVSAVCLLVLSLNCTFHNNIKTKQQKQTEPNEQGKAEASLSSLVSYTLPVSLFVLTLIQFIKLASRKSQNAE